MKKVRKEKKVFKNKYNVIIAVFFVLFFIVVAVSLSSNYSNKEEKEQDKVLEDYKNKSIEEIQTEKITRDEVNDFVDKIFNEKTSIIDIEKMTSTDLSNRHIYYGKDSYFRTMGNGMSNVENIHKIRDTHANKLEEVLKDNFEIELLDYIVTLDDAVVQRVKYKSFYYNEFMKDFEQVYNEIVSYSEYKDYDFEKDINSTKGIADLYKLKVKALEIMCNHLDDYVNKDEYVTYDLVYRKGKTEVENDYLSLYMFFGGHLYEHKSLPEDEREERVNSMINEAIKEGTLNVSNPYSFE